MIIPKKELKEMAMMKKDLIIERNWGLLDEIKVFLKNGINSKFLFIDLDCSFISQRARELDKEKSTLKNGVINTLNQKNDDLKKRYPDQVNVKISDFYPFIFRVNIIENVIVLVFYNKKKRYKQNFFVITVILHFFYHWKKYLKFLG